MTASDGAGQPTHVREALFAAGSALFAERGDDAASMSEIAECLDVAKASLYSHVASKRDLLHAVTRSYRSTLSLLTSEARESPGSAADRLRRLVRGLAEEAEADPSGSTLAWGTGTQCGTGRTTISPPPGSRCTGAW